MWDIIPDFVKSLEVIVVTRDGFIPGPSFERNRRGVCAYVTTRRLPNDGEDVDRDRAAAATSPGPDQS